MELKKAQNMMKGFLQKYRYVVLILAVGLLFMLIPSFSAEESLDVETKSSISVGQQDVQVELEQILSQISGAGKVQVMLTIAKGEQTIYQKNEDVSVSDTSSTTKVDVVTVTDANRNETGLIQQINPATYLGAVILCQGADSPTVKLAILEAVSKITGLGADNIAILKMK